MAEIITAIADGKYLKAITLKESTPAGSNGLNDILGTLYSFVGIRRCRLSCGHTLRRRIRSKWQTFFDRCMQSKS